MKACNACEDFHSDGETCPKTKKLIEPKTERSYVGVSLGRLMAEEIKTESAYSKALEKEKELYDRYLKAMCERAVKMKQWLNAQREVEILKRGMGIQ